MMRFVWSALILGLILSMSTVGCEKSPQKKGGPGAESGKKDRDPGGEADESTFSIDPPDSATIKQGDKQQITIAINISYFCCTDNPFNGGALVNAARLALLHQARGRVATFGARQY